MEFKPVSPIRYSRANSYTEDCFHLKTNSSDSKFVSMDFSDLTNKFIIIPEEIFTLELNVLEMCDTFILRNLVCKIFKTLFEKYEFYKVSSNKIKLFVKDICDKYNEVPYHNFYHATHIIHTTYVLLEKCDLLSRMNIYVVFSVLLSALLHDVDHPGNNNIFEINTCSELALRYNDLSVLEQHHCHVAFELIKKHNIFEHFSQDEYIICRKTIIACILGTDMANHKNVLEQIKIKKTLGFNMDSLDEQYLLGKIIVHAADIGNPIQKYELCEKWARMVSQEFHNQIMKEEGRGFKPFTSFNINSESSFYSHEIRYITYVAKPYWEELANIFKCLELELEQINSNLQIYTSKHRELEQLHIEINMEEF
jgi:hypothetical protein